MNRRLPYDFPRILAVQCSLLIAAACHQRCAVAGDSVTALALALDGENAVTGSHDGLFLRSGMRFRTAEKIPSEVEAIHDVRWAADGMRLAVAGGAPAQFGLVEIFDWPGMSIAARIREHDDVVYSVSWSPDGELLATASLDGTCLISNTISGMPLQQIKGHSKGVTGVEWLTPSRDDDADQSGRIITCSLDQTIRVWSIDKETPASDPVLVRTMDQHTGAVMGMALQPGTEMEAAPVLASWGDDRTVRFWQPDNGRLLRFARLPAGVTSAVWSADGRELFACLESGAMTRISLATAGVMEMGRTDNLITALALSRRTGTLITGDSSGECIEFGISE